MSEITYEKTGNVTKVRLNGFAIGHIQSAVGGFQYTPKGQMLGGEVFPTLDLCKQSLEVVDAATQEEQQEEQPKTYHAKSIRVTWRDKTASFDQELEEHLNSEAVAGYTLERVEQLVLSRPAGMKDEVVAVVITKANE